MLSRCWGTAVQNRGSYTHNKAAIRKWRVQINQCLIQENGAITSSRDFIMEGIERDKITVSERKDSN